MIKRFINNSSPVDVVKFGAEALKRRKGYGLIITRPLRSGDCLMTSKGDQRAIEDNPDQLEKEIREFGFEGEIINSNDRDVY